MVAVTLALSSFVTTGQAHAHGFGARYDLPIPLSLYLAGAGLTVAVSFVMLAVFMRSAPASDEHWRLNLTRTAGGRLLVAPAFLLACRTLAVALFLVVVAAGLFGVQSPLKNIAPVMVWAIWWVGMAYISALLGDLWALVNPLDTLFAWAEALCARIRPGGRLAIGLRYPDALGAWPAVVLFLAFVWMELVWESSDAPAYLAAAMLAYSALTWLGMLLFGRTQWLPAAARCSRWCSACWHASPRPRCANRVPEAARSACAPTASVCCRANRCLPRWSCWCWRCSPPCRFDGFMETPLWASILEYYAPSAPGMAGDGDAARTWLQTAGVLGAPLLFVGVYLAFCRLTAWCGDTRVPVMRIAGLFVLTLVPIAIAYHLAHYLSFLAMAWQYLIPLVSDPFGFGWDLFGTKNHFVRIGSVDARAVWYISIGAIVIGHVIAVYLAHCVALQAYSDRRAALRSQWPMVALMIGYTMTSLWIIAQPIVTTR